MPSSVNVSLNASRWPSRCTSHSTPSHSTTISIGSARLFGVVSEASTDVGTARADVDGGGTRVSRPERRPRE